MEKVSMYQQEYRIPVSQECVRSFRDPHLADVTTIHALVKVRDLPNGKIPDKINPRSHDKIKMTSRIPEAIQDALVDTPELFHLLNRGCLIIAKKAWYDNQSKTLHFIIESEDEHGMVDGATTDRVLAFMKTEASKADFTTLKEDEIPEHFKESYIHLEVIAGDIGQDLRIKLADARNTSEQVKEFSLEDLGGGFDWLKDIIESSPLRGKIRYRENEPMPVDIRIVLALLTLFHPEWLKINRDPVIAYTGKGGVLDLYTDKDPKSPWPTGYKKLEPVVLDILKLYEYVHVGFLNAYKKAYEEDCIRAPKLGRRKEVHYIEDAKKAKELPLTGAKTQYVIPDGWLYPLLASLRVLLDWPKSGRGDVKWIRDPFKFFDDIGAELVAILIEAAEDSARNPNATGKSRRLWGELRTRVENKILKESMAAYT